jgi:hypothetical protein
MLLPAVLLVSHWPTDTSAVTLLFTFIQQALALHAQAQVTPTSDVSFSTIGYISAATVAKQGAATDAKLFGGTVTVNNVVHIIPDNTVCTLPANTALWSEMFSAIAPGNPARIAPTLQNLEISLNGNIVAGKYIAGESYWYMSTK